LLRLYVRGHILFIMIENYVGSELLQMCVKNACLVVPIWLATSLPTQCKLSLQNLWASALQQLTKYLTNLRAITYNLREYTWHALVSSLP